MIIEKLVEHIAEIDVGANFHTFYKNVLTGSDSLVGVRCECQ